MGSRVPRQQGPARDWRAGYSRRRPGNALKIPANWLRPSLSRGRSSTGAGASNSAKGPKAQAGATRGASRRCRTSRQDRPAGREGARGPVAGWPPGPSLDRRTGALSGFRRLFGWPPLWCRPSMVPARSSKPPRGQVMNSTRGLRTATDPRRRRWVDVSSGQVHSLTLTGERTLPGIWHEKLLGLRKPALCIRARQAGDRRALCRQLSSHRDGLLTRGPDPALTAAVGGLAGSTGSTGAG